MIGENKGAVFAMAFHCHQPVDNFGWEFEHAYSGAYLPLLEKFEEFAGVKGAFHFSGSVLEWIEKEHPEYISRMSVLIARGQVEIIGGGCYEPVMSMIPETDRLEQIKMNDGLIRRLFGCKTRGVWLAEKVWEPFLAGTLKKAGAEYTIVDDYHILRAGHGEEEAHSPCCHDSGHGKIILFPSHTRLRYYMPFKAPEVTIEHMRGLSSDPVLERKCFFFADDGEKFGAWPYTFWWVHKKGWLRQFFERLSENSSWLTTATYSEVLDGCAHRCVGEVPSSSYAEMMEWSGGDFRNFLSKYPESGRMHARMTSVSTLVKEAMDGRVPSLAPELILDARREVFKAQANCAYWHGTFGGVYLPHLRAGVYRHLITAENLLEDPPCDGRKGFVRVLERSSRQEEREILFRNDNVDIFLSPGRGGAITEFDDRRACVNLMNNLSRIPEGYHDKLKRSSYGRIREARKAIFRGDYADVHYVLGIKDRGLSRELAVDAHRRYSFLTHISAGPLRLEDMPRGRGGNARFLDGAYTYSLNDAAGTPEMRLSRRDKIFSRPGRSFDISVKKTVSMERASAGIRMTQVLEGYAGKAVLDHAVEFNFSLWDDTMIGGPRVFRGDSIRIECRHSGIAVKMTFEERHEILTYPVFTVNETEAGLSRTFQGISVVVKGGPSQSKGALMNNGITIEMGSVRT